MTFLDRCRCNPLPAPQHTKTRSRSGEGAFVSMLATVTEEVDQGECLVDGGVTTDDDFSRRLTCQLRQLEYLMTQEDPEEYGKVETLVWQSAAMLSKSQALRTINMGTNPPLLSILNDWAAIQYRSRHWKDAERTFRSVVKLCEDHEMVFSRPWADAMFGIGCLNNEGYSPDHHPAEGFRNLLDAYAGYCTSLGPLSYTATECLRRAAVSTTDPEYIIFCRAMLSSRHGRTGNRSLDILRNAANMDSLARALETVGKPVQAARARRYRNILRRQAENALRWIVIDDSPNDGIRIQHAVLPEHTTAVPQPPDEIFRLCASLLKQRQLDDVRHILVTVYCDFRAMATGCTAANALELLESDPKTYDLIANAYISFHRELRKAHQQAYGKCPELWRWNSSCLRRWSESKQDMARFVQIVSLVAVSLLCAGDPDGAHSIAAMLYFEKSLTEMDTDGLSSEERDAFCGLGDILCMSYDACYSSILRILYQTDAPYTYQTRYEMYAHYLGTDDVLTRIARELESTIAEEAGRYGHSL